MFCRGLIRRTTPTLSRIRPTGERGIGYLTLIVFGTIVAAVLYAGYHIIPFYYYFYELQNQMDSVVTLASTESDTIIRRRLTAQMRRTEIPAKPEDLKIRRVNNKIILDLEYREVFYVTWQGKDYDLRTFDFHAHSEGEF